MKSAVASSSTFKRERKLDFAPYTESALFNRYIPSPFLISLKPDSHPEITTNSVPFQSNCVTSEAVKYLKETLFKS